MSSAITINRLRFGVQSWLYAVVLLAAPVAVFGPGIVRWWHRPRFRHAPRIVISSKEEVSQPRFSSP